MRLLFHVSGAHASLPEAELRTALEACGMPWLDGGRDGRLVVAHLERRKTTAVRTALDRLALTHEVSRLLFSAPRSEDAILEAASQHPPGRDGGAGGPSFMVRAEYTHPGARGAGPSRSEVERLVGRAWSAHARVDLERPERVVRVFLGRDRVWAGLRLWQNDASGYRARAARMRPFFSPVSGHPALMRAVVNLARVPPGGLVYDPLAGTGGTLIEAGLAGMQVAGSDHDPAMVQGSRENLEHFRVPAVALFVADVRDAPERFLLTVGRPHADAVVTDLPYGQSSSTHGATPQDVARWCLVAAARLLPPGGRLVVGTGRSVRLEEPRAHSFVQVARFDVRVHKSLTRSYHVLERNRDESAP